MNKLVNETVGEELYQYYPLGDYVVRAPGVCGGASHIQIYPP
jgi:hypothetical protein